MKFSAQFIVLFGLVATAIAYNAPIEARDPKKTKTGGGSQDAVSSAIASGSFAAPTAAPRIAGVAAVGAVAVAAVYW
ncbi:hypothetical protein BDD12DRAFT_893023 [Trichophaea hybrida]|nr:hypothetical protein BDD12DRAFT_893023 [Trichophaea hybrida]